MHLWSRFLENLEKELGKDTVNKWLRPIKIVRFDACNLYLEPQDSFQIVWFKEHVSHLANKRLLNHAMRPIKIHLNDPSTIVHQKPVAPSSVQFLHDSIDPAFSYENFVSSKSNTFAFQILSELVGFDPTTGGFNSLNSSRDTYNPILLFGDEGCGKTHLLSATTLALQKQNINVLYVKAETFTEHMIKAMRQGLMATFRDTYRLADMLIVDNIEHFSNKNATQEEFFHTFNTYHSAGKQIVLGSSVPPKKLQKIEPRLISRFEWGITLALSPLSKGELPLLLLKKIKFFNLSLSREISEYLLSTFNHPKYLAQALELLSYKEHLHRQIVTIEDVRQITNALIEKLPNNKLSSDKILHAVSEIFEKTLEDLLGKGQTKDVVFPRKIAMYLLRYKLKMPYIKIGNLFSKDHSTVMSSIKQITQAIKSKESKVLNSLEYLERKIIG
jgi:chromosomal replication initiator protein